MPFVKKYISDMERIQGEIEATMKWAGGVGTIEEQVEQFMAEHYPKLIFRGWEIVIDKGGEIGLVKYHGQGQSNYDEKLWDEDMYMAFERWVKEGR